MSTFNSISAPILALIEHLSNLHRSHYQQAERFFTADFNYFFEQEDTTGLNMKYYFLDNLNNSAYKYEVKKIKEISPHVYLVYLSCINLRKQSYYLDSNLIHEVSLVLIKKIKKQYYISDVIEFKKQDFNPIYAVLEKFS